MGGKLDRERLPPLRADEGPTSAETRARTLLETAVTRAFREALNLLGDPPLHADFFNDLGGDSLGAALTVSLLREDPGTAALVMRALVQQCRLHGAALVLVTHSEAATAGADRVLHLRADGMHAG